VNRSKAKGTAAETAVVNYLGDHGIACERRALNGTQDRGDVAGISGVVLEVKNCAKTELAGWVDELRVEMRNDGAHVGAVVHKRRGKSSPGEWFCTMPFDVFVRLLNERNGR
jgi:hypothetical protein